MRSDRADSETSVVLLVEDNPGDVRLVEEAFAEASFDVDVRVVDDGVEALDFLSRREAYADAPRPDLVLLDLNLPRTGGHEVLEELRADPETRTVPVVVLTSSRAESDVTEAYERGANSYITKPVDPGEFIDAILTLTRYWVSVVRLPGAADGE